MSKITTNTQFFKVNSETEVSVKDILDTVYNAMTEKAVSYTHLDVYKRQDHDGGFW